MVRGLVCGLLKLPGTLELSVGARIVLLHACREYHNLYGEMSAWVNRRHMLPMWV